VLQLLEEKARQLGASRATLDTMGFQAEKLYEKTATPNLDDLPTSPPDMTEFT
jgi:hypothetical protein